MGAPKTWAISHAVMAKVAAEANSSDHAMSVYRKALAHYDGNVSRAAYNAGRHDAQCRLVEAILDNRACTCGWGSAPDQAPAQGER